MLAHQIKISKNFKKLFQIFFARFIKKTSFQTNAFFLVTYNCFILILAQIFNYSLFFKSLLSDIFGLDLVGKKFRFNVIYIFNSLNLAMRFFIFSKIKAFSSALSSLFLYNSGNWLEREIWDLFGIYFYGHIDLRRILTDYGFKGHPLRRNFPLSGFVELWYSDMKKRILYTKIVLFQEFRNFEFLFSYWGQSPLPAEF